MQLRKRTLAVVLLAAACLSSPGLAVQYSAPAVSGYDVVSYFEGEKPLPGNGNHVVVHDGATYLFVDEENRRAFEKDPERYVPAYGGYCAYGVAVGKKFVSDPTVWEIVHGRLYLNLDNKIKGLWMEDVPGHIEKADAHWTTIRSRSPADL
jgi:YHS domain-containing protein